MVFLESGEDPCSFQNIETLHLLVVLQRSPSPQVFTLLVLLWSFLLPHLLVRSLSCHFTRSGSPPKDDDGQQEAEQPSADEDHHHTQEPANRDSDHQLQVEAGGLQTPSPEPEVKLQLPE